MLSQTCLYAMRTVPTKRKIILVMSNNTAEKRGSGALNETYGLVYIDSNGYKKTW